MRLEFVQRFNVLVKCLNGSNTKTLQVIFIHGQEVSNCRDTQTWIDKYCLQFDAKMNTLLQSVCIIRCNDAMGKRDNPY